MAIADFASVGHSVHSPFARGFHAIADWLAAYRIARARKQVLLDLLFAPEHRLRDIGITREQLSREVETQNKAIALR